jgi:ABC-type lipoprotein export system ATPase subunit
MSAMASIAASPATDAPLLEIEGLCKSFFGVEVLHKVGFSLRAGRVLGLVGENGSGKSTTMNIIGGVHQMDAGRISFDGADYRPKGPRDASKQGIAFIHQELNLFRNLSIAENLFITEFPKLVPGLPFIDRGAARKRAAELLAAVDLDIPPATLVNRLSQGERQLVEIAKAWAPRQRSSSSTSQRHRLPRARPTASSISSTSFASRASLSSTSATFSTISCGSAMISSCCAMATLWVKPSRPT